MNINFFIYIFLDSSFLKKSLFGVVYRTSEYAILNHRNGKCCTIFSLENVDITDCHNMPQSPRSLSSKNLLGLLEFLAFLARYPGKISHLQLEIPRTSVTT